MSKPTLANGPMRYAPVVVCTLGLFYLLLVNAFTYSALADHPKVGKDIRSATIPRTLPRNRWPSGSRRTRRPQSRSSSATRKARNSRACNGSTG